jgi:hypothetical protein
LLYLYRAATGFTGHLIKLYGHLDYAQ